MQKQRMVLSEHEEIVEEYVQLNCHAARPQEKAGTAEEQEKKQDLLVSEIVSTCHHELQQMRQSELQSETFPSIRSSPQHRVKAI